MKYEKGRIMRVLAMVIVVIAITGSLVMPTLNSNVVHAANMPNSKLVCGSTHSLVIDGSGNVWSFGQNTFGQLGDGTTQDRWIPLLVYSSSFKGRAVAVAAGSRQSLVLTESGIVLMWGYGQILSAANAVVQTEGNIVSISAGGEFCAAIKTDGTAIIWSDKQEQRTVERNDNGNMVTLTGVNEIDVGSNNTIILRAHADNVVYSVSRDDYRTASPVFLLSPDFSEPLSQEDTPLKNIKSISAGENFALALSDAGDVYTWGNNAGGVLGRGSFYPENPDVLIKYADKVATPSKIKYISAGSGHVIVLSESGTFYGWGSAKQWKLDNEKSGIFYSPEQLNLNLGTDAVYDCAGAFNIAYSSNELKLWGNSMGMSTLTLKQTLKKSGIPECTISNVKSDGMTVSWTPSDYFTGLVNGFTVVYTKPDGSEQRTMLLPITTDSITLQGLLPELNYSVKLVVHSFSGFTQESSVVKATTLKPQVSSLESSLVSSQNTSAQSTSAESSLDSSSGIMSDGNSKPVNDPLIGVFNGLLIALVVAVVLAAAVFVYFIWKKMSNKIDDETYESDASMEDVEDYSDDDYFDKGHMGDLVKGVNQNTIEIPLDENPNEQAPGTNSETDDSDDDDFIIRKPGQPKK